MEKTYLNWNVTNWISVVLMAALGFMVLSLGVGAYHKVSGTSDSSGNGNSGGGSQ